MNLDVRYGMARKWASVYLISLFCSFLNVNRLSSKNAAQTLLMCFHYKHNITLIPLFMNRLRFCS